MNYKNKKWTFSLYTDFYTKKNLNTWEVSELISHQSDLEPSLIIDKCFLIIALFHHTKWSVTAPAG